MPRSTGRPKAVTELVKKADASIDKDDLSKADYYLEKAVRAQRSRRDWIDMAQLLEHLQEVRRMRRKAALASRAAVRLIDTEDAAAEPAVKGRYLFQPPLVGADARQFWLAAADKGVPVAVICREPTTRLGEIPVVAIAPGATVRVRIEPPDDEAKPSAGWFRGAMDALNTESLNMDQPDLELAKRVDRLLALIDAVGDADGPIERLIEVCRSHDDAD